jgi:ribonuclease HII
MPRVAEKRRPFDDLPAAFENARALCGIDEVGRGPLAGPVVAAAVILPARFPVDILADSKALKASARVEIAREIKRLSVCAIVAVPPETIDRLNIRGATLRAMRRAVFALPVLPDAALVDGRDVPPGLPCPARAIIAGDARQPAIAAASIVAKVARDRLMADAARFFPGYGFERHMGYPAPEHLAALRHLGLTPLHRMSFGPCRAASAKEAS